MRNRDILLVEDNPDDIELMRIALEEADLDSTLVVVRDGAEALDYLFARGEHEACGRNRLPAIVLLDINLPKLDGREVLKAIRGNDRTRNLPVVILTTSTEPLDVEASYGLGANSYIRKPLDFGKFIQVVRQIGTYWLVVNHRSDHRQSGT